MIFFFHHYELPALLEQIRQQQQVPPHQDQQAADGHAGPDNNAPSADDSDQSGGGWPVDTEVEQQDVVVNDASEADRVTFEADNPSHQLSSVDHAEQGHCTNVAEHGVQQFHVSHNVGVVDEASQISAALTQPTSRSASFHSTTVASDEDNDHGSCAAAHVHRDLPLSPSCEVTDVIPTDVRELSSPLAVDSSMELRRRYQASNSVSPSSSFSAFTNCQELCTDRPRGDRTVDSAETLTDNSHAEVQQSNYSLLLTSPSHTE